MKLLMANIAGIEPNSAGARFVGTVLAPLTQRNAETVMGQSDSMVFRFASHGATHPAFIDFPHLSTANPPAMRAMAGQAQQQGFDAVIMGCFGNPQLWETRAEVDLPVAGFGESAILAAAAAGKRIGVVSASASLAEPIARQLDSYGLHDRLVDVLSIDETGPQQEHSMSDSTELIAKFCQLGRDLIAKGADVLLPACGLMSPALRLAPGAESAYPDGLRHVDGVPIVDVIAASTVDALSMARVGAARRRAEAGGAPAHRAEQPRQPAYELWDVA